MSSTTADSWCTPKWLADLLGTFDLDPCSNDASHIVSYARCALEGNEHRDIVARDGLTFDWAETNLGRLSVSRVSVFANVPYSDVMPWAKKLVAHDGPWVALLKLDPSTRWWAELMRANPTVAAFRKRIKFEGDRAMTANFPSALIYSAWRPSAALRAHLWLPTYAEGVSL